MGYSSDGRRDRSILRSMLKFWGYWNGKLMAADGYPPEEVVSRLKSGFSGKFGHKILIPDMPHRAWKIHYLVLELPFDEQDVLVAAYCMPPRYSDGHMWTRGELAGFLGISEHQYRDRHSSAHKRLTARLFS